MGGSWGEIHTVFDEESKSAVRIDEFLHPEEKIKKNQPDRVSISYRTSFPREKTLAQTSELVPGGVLGVRNPNLRSKMLKNDLQRRKTRKNYYY